MKRGQDLVVAIAWNMLGGGDRIPPIVEWYEGKKLDCIPGHAFWGTALDDKGTFYQTCLRGEYIPAMHLAIVAWTNTKISDTAFVHELCHAAKPNTEHTICYSEGGIVKQINEYINGIGF